MQSALLALNNESLGTGINSDIDDILAKFDDIENSLDSWVTRRSILMTEKVELDSYTEEINTRVTEWNDADF